ncbi:hypothetical protein A3J23_02640 [Candidatus Peregrinibacteria bacterium RIFCSPLOWO2_02_FULL_48_14]|nr:MAG: hypothetical protein A2974_02000 [Candidatus Peregrinibacteria bacterium RIFCSPLOWO2_01_FULL_48_20]OGJ46008.1 MAG: hypothetical protein A3J23_02640 [Candidatus Peregrinibacteria bacterium RIFCSPLOWO2_02_FULL_48_14]
MSEIILILPGWGDSGPEHWQSLWLKKYPNAVKVEQQDWQNPKKDGWIKALNETIEKYKGHELILVGHSLACPTIAHWAKQFGQTTKAKIKGALLVAPGDADAPGFPSEIQGFTPIPLDTLPFKSILVAGDNDLWVSLDRAKLFAKSWGSELVILPGAGHINAAAGFGEWPEGEKLLKLLKIRILNEEILKHPFKFQKGFTAEKVRELNRRKRY